MLCPFQYSPGLSGKLILCKHDIYITTFIAKLPQILLIFIRNRNKLLHKVHFIHDSVTDDAHISHLWCLSERKDCRKQWVERTHKCKETVWITWGGKRTVAYNLDTHSHTRTHTQLKYIFMAWASCIWQSMRVNFS